MARLSLRIAGLVLLGYALWLSISVSLANAFADAAPEAALWFRPDDAAANSRLAELALASAPITPAKLAAADEHARRALLRDLTQTTAYRVLALTAGARGNEPAAERLMVVVDQWTRRDLADQLYLIELNVRRNDIPAVLRHYAIALTVRPDAKTILFPILIQGIREAGLVEPIATFLARDSDWRHELLFRIAGESDSLSNIDRLLRSVRRKGGAVDLDVVRVLLARLVRANLYAAAERQAALAVGEAGAPVRNGTFQSPPRVAPLDWDLANSGSARADIDVDSEGAGSRLTFDYTDDQPAMLARQLLVLAPGRYRLASRLELESPVTSGEAPAWTLRCVDGPQLTRLGPATRPGIPAVSFQVPSGCPAQWLELGGGGETGTQHISGTVRSVSVAPAAGG